MRRDTQLSDENIQLQPRLRLSNVQKIQSNQRPQTQGNIAEPGHPLSNKESPNFAMKLRGRNFGKKQHSQTPSALVLTNEMILSSQIAQMNEHKESRKSQAHTAIAGSGDGW